MSIPSHNPLRSLPSGDVEETAKSSEPSAINRRNGSEGHAREAPGSTRIHGASASQRHNIHRRRSSVWREQVRARLADLRVELDGLAPAPGSEPWREDAYQRLAEAEAILDRRPGLVDVWTGVDIESTWMKVHAIEVALVRLSPPKVIRAKLPRIIADGARLFGETHPRVKILQAFQKRSHWGEEDRECLAQSVRAVYEESDKENVRLRSFRNILLGAAAALALLAIGFAVFGAVDPAAIDDLAQSPASGYSLQGSAAVSRTELLVVEILGLVSASLVGAVAIRHIQGTSTVYGVPMASLLLKLPTGALTALAGILLIRAGIVPGLTVSADTHLGAYALLFGASQQGFTGLVDRQANSVLNNVSSKDNG